MEFLVERTQNLLSVICGLRLGCLFACTLVLSEDK